MTDPQEDELSEKLKSDWLMEQEYDARVMRRMRDEDFDMEDQEDDR